MQKSKGQTNGRLAVIGTRVVIQLAVCELLLLAFVDGGVGSVDGDGHGHGCG
jgi:hypothetical protein